MAQEGIEIQDIHLQEHLVETIRHSGQTMTEIDGRVGNYLTAVEDALERQLDFLRDKLDEAQEKLQAAEQALSACEASQIIDPATGMIVPTCASEEAEVSAARNEEAECQRKYVEGQRIVAECQSEINDYMAGGHQLICNMSGNQMPKAVEHLSDIIGKAKAIMDTRVVTELPEINIAMNSHSDAANQTPANDDRFDVFRESMRKETT